MAIDWKKVGTGMQGMGAWFQGQGPQWQQEQARQQELALQRKERERAELKQREDQTAQRMAYNIRSAKELLGRDPRAAMNLLNEIKQGVPGAAQSDQFKKLDRMIDDTIKASMSGNQQAVPGILQRMGSELEAMDRSFVGRGYIAPSAASKPMTLSPGEKAFDQSGNVLFENPDDQSRDTFLNPDGTINENYVRARQQVASAGASNQDINVNAVEDYVSNRTAAQAERMTEIERAAGSAYRANQALDRFLEASKGGAEGGFQPIMTGVKNLISSFGFDPDGLTEETVMQSAISEILQQKMDELGARGLTDEDMKILRNALPRTETSRAAREAVARIVKKTNDYTISSYIDRVRWEDENSRGANYYREPWVKDWAPSVEPVLPPFVPVSTTEPENTTATDDFGRRIIVKNGVWVVLNE